MSLFFRAAGDIALPAKTDFLFKQGQGGTIF